MASGDVLGIFTPFQNEPPTSSYATLDTRNAHPVLDFNGASNESAVFTDVMRANYGGGGYTVDIWWTCDDAGNGTTDDVDFDVAFERLATADQDIDSDGFAAVNSDDATLTPTTSGVITKSTVTFTDGADADSVTAGDLYRLKVTRDAASDNEDGDVNVLAVQISET